MIKNETIKIKVSSGLKQNYSGLGYDFNSEYVYFRIKDLKEVSNQKIDVICDICKSEYIIQYCKYIKNLKRNGIYSCKKCGISKRSEKFKMDNPSLSKEYQAKKKQTFIEKYGVDNPSKAPEVKIKKLNTILKNYGVDSPFKLRDIMKKGMKDKYGVEYPLQSEEIISKMKDRLIEKYDVDNVSNMESVKNKKKTTSRYNYGVNNPMQNSIIFKKQLLSSYRLIYFNSDLFAQGTYELDFLNHCSDIGIIDEVSSGPSIRYRIENKYHIYHSDFFIKKYNLIVEVKSSYTFKSDINRNLIKKEYSENSGYKFIFIIDKEYTEFDKILKKETQS